MEIVGYIIRLQEVNNVLLKSYILPEQFYNISLALIFGVICNLEKCHRNVRECGGHISL